MLLLLQELNRVVHNMQLRISSLIERCQDEIILESTLIINDDLNTLFVRYDRWLKNSAAVKSILAGEQQGPPISVAEHATTTTSIDATVRGFFVCNVQYIYMYAAMWHIHVCNMYVT